MTLRRSIVALIVLVLLGVGGAWYWKSAHTSVKVVRIGIATWAGFGNVFSKQAARYWPGLKIEAKVIDDARAREASFVSGQLDVMISSVDLFAQEAANGIPGKIVLATDSSNGGDGIVAKLDIPSIADLKGRKIAVTVGAPSQFLLENLLRQSRMSVRDVQVVKVDDPQRAAEVFASGDVDAAVTWEPFLSEAASKNGKILATSKMVPDTIVDVLVAGPHFVSQKQLLEEFLRGWLQAAEDLRQATPETVSAMASGFGIKNEDVTACLPA